MFCRIMVPLDGSELAERALPCAQRFAGAGGAVLHLVRVVEAPVRSTWVPGPVFVAVRAYDDPVERATDEATTYLTRLHMRLAAAGLGVTVAHPVETSGPGAALVAYERTAAIDLVIMCSHGRSGVARFTLGSVATYMLRHGTAPILLVRPSEPALPMQRAMVPLDGSPQSEEALHVAADLLGPIVQEVTLLRVVDRRNEVPAAQRYLDAVRPRLYRDGQGAGLVCQTQVTQGDPAQVIMEATGTEALVVMATHGRSALARLALGSVADRVAREGRAPILLVRAHSLQARVDALALDRTGEGSRRR